MEQIRQKLGISFQDLEWALKQEYDRGFAQSVKEALEILDEWILQNRDRSRYKAVDRRERTVQTVIGVAVTFKRRYYLDVETGQYVFLLDELLGLPKEKQISPALTEVAVMLGVSGPSYRISAEHLEHSHGGKIISHESIRQAVLRAGEAVAAEEASKMREGEGERRVPVLFVEVDGLNVRLQGESRKRVEAKVMVTHEGWRPRHPGSKEYELVNPKFFVAHDGEDFWEEASAHVMRNYKIDKDVTVVINGDRASWTRKGLEYFPKAMYQVDRFHLKRELRTLFGKHSECLARLYEELEMPDPTGARFLACLAECSSKLPSKKRRQEAYNLLQDLASIPGSVVDYRIRLQQEGIDTSSMRGLGSIEAQMDRISDRIKRRGQKWSLNGLQAIMQLLCRRFEGNLVSLLKRLAGTVSGVCEALTEGIARTRSTARKVLEYEYGIQIVHSPMMDAGRTRSGGMSHFLHRLSHDCNI